MTQPFNFTKKELKKMGKWFKKRGPLQFQFASALTLNDAAALSRQKTLVKLDDDFDVRAARFVSSVTQFRKTTVKKKLNKQFTMAGTKPRKRFRGWVEQQAGTKATRTKVATKAGRGGSFKKKIKSRYRMNKRGPMLETKDLSLQHMPTEHKRVNAMLARADRERFNGPMIIHDHAKIPDGIYRFKPGGGKGERKLEALQFFDAKNVQPKRTNFMGRVVRDMTQPGVLSRLFFKNAKRVIKQ
jgi:hypothetical protein